MKEKTAANLFEVGIKRTNNRVKAGASFMFHLFRSTGQNVAKYPLFGQLEDLNGLKILTRVANIEDRSKLVVLLEFPLEK